MTEDEMDTLLTELENRFGRSWIDIVEWMREQNTLDDLTAAIERGDFASAMHSIADAADRFAADVHAGYITAGQRVAAWLDTQTADTLVRFDVGAPRAVAWAEQNKLSLVKGLTEEQREVTRRIIAEGIRDGENPRVIARELRDSIGLTTTQYEAVASYRAALEGGDFANALDRALSHGQSDRTIAAAAEAERALTPAQIDLAVERYRQAYVNYRAVVISRTEALRTMHQANQEAFEQAIARGDVAAKDLEQQWNATHDSRTRSTHVTMDKQKRAWGETFTTGGGVELLYPGDPNGPPEETIQCRCIITTRYRPK